MDMMQPFVLHAWGQDQTLHEVGVLHARKRPLGAAYWLDRLRNPSYPNPPPPASPALVIYPTTASKVGPAALSRGRQGTRPANKQP
jgi:hypothetical protein